MGRPEAAALLMVCSGLVSSAGGTEPQPARSNPSAAPAKAPATTAVTASQSLFGRQVPGPGGAPSRHAIHISIVCRINPPQLHAAPELTASALVRREPACLFRQFHC